MNRLRITIALVLLCGLAINSQAQGDQEKHGADTLEAVVAPYFRLLDDAASKLAKALQAAALPACADLDSDNLHVIETANALSADTLYCREIARDGEFVINPGAIGSQIVIERGVRQAYDVFGLTVEGAAVARFDRAITVCLRGRGEMIFLPAFASPRPAQTPQAYPSGEFTCARIGSPGILALVAGQA